MGYKNPQFEALRAGLHPSTLLSTSPNRFGIAISESSGGWHGLATSIRNSDPSQIVYFPDSNVGILEAAEPFWTSVRLAAMSAGRESAILSSSAYAEWIDKSFDTEARACAAKSAIMTPGGWLKVFSITAETDGPYYRGLMYYLRLLSIRRAIAIPDENTSSSTQSLMNNVVNKIGTRGVKLARKGHRDKNKSGVINVNDEAHVLETIYCGLKSGVSTCIVTADEDCLEIFLKSVETIKRHYLAWLAALRINAGHLGPPAARTSGEELADFVGPVDLYSASYDDCRDIFPVDYTRVAIHCIFVHDNRTIYHVKADFEQEVGCMLGVKGQTGGRSTDVFGHNDIHLIDIHEKSSIVQGKYFALGNPLSVPCQESDISFDIAVLDMKMVVNCLDTSNYWQPDI